MLRINIESLGADPQEFRWEISAQGIELDQEIKHLGPVQVWGKIQRIHEKAYIRGKTQTQVELVCARCLKEFRFDLVAELFIIAIPTLALGKEAAGGKISELVEDPVILTYPGKEIDLLPDVRTALILALPIKPLCQPDCPGLCPQCGAVLAEGMCQCEVLSQRRPLAALDESSPSDKNGS